MQAVAEDHERLGGLWKAHIKLPPENAQSPRQRSRRSPNGHRSDGHPDDGVEVRFDPRQVYAVGMLIVRWGGWYDGRP